MQIRISRREASVASVRWDCFIVGNLFEREETLHLLEVYGFSNSSR